MKEKEILEIFRKTNAILDGHFNLSSGLHSPTYLQCAIVLQYPEYAEKLCRALAYKFKDVKPNIVIAPALGGILVAHEVAKALGVKSMFAERKNGVMQLRRGFKLDKKDKVLVVEDVITTGVSVKEVITVVSSFGSEIAGIGCIVDRSKDAIQFKVDFKSLMKLTVPTFKPESCPLCKDGVQLIKPGSRTS